MTKMMKRLPGLLTLCILGISLSLAGCQSGGKESETGNAPAGSQDVTLAGTVGCGHCNFGKTGECSSAIQTADGQVTVIDGVSHDSELWKLREENAKPAEVTGTLSQGTDGLPHLKMSSYKIL
jgi:hypothetical protein